MHSPTDVLAWPSNHFQQHLCESTRSTLLPSLSPDSAASHIIMSPSILITAATGELGKLIVDHLLTAGFPADHITVAVRSPAKVPSEWTAKGVKVQQIDYDAPASDWAQAASGIDRLLLISSSAHGPERQQQHRNVLEGAKLAGVKFIAYTSLLYCDSEYLSLAADHLATERYIKELGIAYAFLRHGWYTENFLRAAPGWKLAGVHVSAAPHAKFSPASRADYAAADAAVISAEKVDASAVYELAGDEVMTYDTLAEAAGKALGKEVKHLPLEREALVQKLQDNGLPPMWAVVLAGIDDAAEKTGGLFNDSKTISTLIGRPTTPWSKTITEALSANGTAGAA